MLKQYNNSIFDDTFFNVFFKDLFDTKSIFLPLGEVKKIPHPVDIYSDEDNIYFEISAIGLDRKDIHIKLKDDLLNITYKKKDEETKKNYLYKGITKKSFNLSYKIGSMYDLDKIEAKENKGLLLIKIPILESKRDREIEIN